VPLLMNIMELLLNIANSIMLYAGTTQKFQMPVL